jgi:hypothetical protein
MSIKNQRYTPWILLQLKFVSIHIFTCILKTMNDFHRNRAEVRYVKYNFTKTKKIL